MSGVHHWDSLRPDGTHIWNTLGYRRAGGENGRAILEWDAAAEYGFPVDGSRQIVHGGMVATLLDTAMGHACVDYLGGGHFLTADLHVEFYRSALPGLLRAEAEVVHGGRRVVYCSASLYDPEGTLLASARCTQIVRSGHV